VSAGDTARHSPPDAGNSDGNPTIGRGARIKEIGPSQTWRFPHQERMAGAMSHGVGDALAVFESIGDLRLRRGFGPLPSLFHCPCGCIA